MDRNTNFTDIIGAGMVSLVAFGLFFGYVLETPFTHFYQAIASVIGMTWATAYCYRENISQFFGKFKK
jgi:hypothetical protein